MLSIRTVAAAFTLISATVATADSPQFRGPERSGVFQESGLLASWPEGGPKLLWSADGLGEGFASVSVVGDHSYTTGMHNDRGWAFAFDGKGQQVWKSEYGAEHPNGYPGTRTTPTFADGSLFLLSSVGDAIALDAATGKVQWKVNILEEFDGENLFFGISESPLIDGERVIYTPGGKKGTVVALDRKTGATVWASPSTGDKSAYCNPRLFEHDGQRQIVTLVEAHMIGVDPAGGDVLWKTPWKAEYSIHAVSPVFDGRSIYAADGYKQGGRMYELAADGKSVTQKWEEKKLDIHHGGAVLLDGHVYGASSGGTWYILNADSGEIAGMIRRAGKGAVVFADGLLYGYVEDGKVLLVDPDPENFRIVSSFEITAGEGHHWAHPVINDGILYIRHGDVLMAFDVRDRG